jgi:hypothetical protein
MVLVLLDGGAHLDRLLPADLSEELLHFQEIALTNPHHHQSASIVEGSQAVTNRSIHSLSISVDKGLDNNEEEIGYLCGVKWLLIL